MNRRHLMAGGFSAMALVALSTATGAVSLPDKPAVDSDGMQIWRRIDQSMESLSKRYKRGELSKENLHREIAERVPDCFRWTSYKRTPSSEWILTSVSRSSNELVFFFIDKNDRLVLNLYDADGILVVSSTAGKGDRIIRRKEDRIIRKKKIDRNRMWAISSPDELI